ncbi:serine hydrolase domain-containing protein [Alkalibacterium sp. f15]|uniref:serine hydrolase domain-containing protein n=1 Tax=Alkalibacterium sp. f15 TaxID=3414029 RepID=UPI003BF7A19A
MKTNNLSKSIENSFRKQVRKDSKIKNAYLLVHSEKEGIHINIAEGSTGTMPANPQQPIYMASVGKLFTSAIIGILVDRGKLSFDDEITKYLDHELTNNLHIYNGKDYTDEVKIKHLLNQTSGLADDFRPLLGKLIKDQNLNITPREAVTWVKNNEKPHFPPGEGFKYTDTNYHLIGLIIESITGEPFHVVLRKYIFEPLDMRHSYMHQFSEPIESSQFPTADFFIDKTKLNDIKGYAGLDYTGGGVVAPTEDLLKFMKALVSYQIVTKNMLEEMKDNCVRFGLGIDYGYGIWKIKTVPLVMPEKLNSWGVAGATGAFMFYHPGKDSYIIGSFNDFSYERKGVRFMLLNVIKQLSKY